MSYIDPFYYSLPFRFHSDPNSIYPSPNKSLYPNIANPLLLCAQMAAIQSNRLALSQNLSSLNYNIKDSRIPSYTGAQTCQDPNLMAFGKFQNFLQHPQTFPIAANFAQNGMYFQNPSNKNFLNNLQNNKFVSLPHYQKQGWDNCKTVSKPMDFMIYLNQPLDVNGNNQVENLPKTNSLYQSMTPETLPKKVENNKLLSKKKKRTSKKKTQETTEEDDSSISDSKNSEKKSTSSSHSNKKKIMRNHAKFDEKGLLLGSFDEYEKFFKNDKPSSEFTDIEKNLIEKIDNPRRRKKKIESETKTDFFVLSPEKIKKLNEEVKAFIPLYEKELEEKKSNKLHMFMMENFPETYEIQNFYIHVRKNEERIQELLTSAESLSFPSANKKNDSTEIKSVWKLNDLDVSKVEEYLYDVEKVWPFEELRFSQEVCLELLKMNNYDSVLSITHIMERDSKFRDLTKIRKLELPKNY